MIRLKQILSEEVDFDHDGVFSPFYTQVMQFEPDEVDVVENSGVYPQYFSKSSPGQIHWQWETPDDHPHDLVFNAVMTKELYDPDKKHREANSLDEKRYKIVTYCYNRKNNRKGICPEFCRTSEKFRDPDYNLKTLKKFIQNIDFIDEDDLLDKKTHFFSRSMDLNL